MKEAGIRFERQASNRIAIPAPQVYAPRNITVEGDCSSASYFWGAAALTGGEVLTSPVSPHSLQGDCRFLGVLDKMGCRVIWEPEGVCVKGPERLLPIDIDMNEMPDMVPTLGVLSAFASGTTRIRNVAHLRIKESDRLKAVAAGLKTLGVEIGRVARWAHCTWGASTQTAFRPDLGFRRSPDRDGLCPCRSAPQRRGYRGGGVCQ